MQKQPLVSVIITAYNEEQYIEEALLSIMHQTYKNLEILVVDDGATDKTLAAIKRLQRQDKRIKILETGKNVGPSLASNLAVDQIKGEFIARIDADDIASLNRVEKQVGYLLQHSKVVVVGGQCRLIDIDGNFIAEKNYPLTHDAIYEALFSMNPLLHPTCMINRKQLPDGKIYYHNHSILAHDLELIFELAQYGKLANLPDIVISYRQHPDSLSLSDPRKTFVATVDVRHRALKVYGYEPTMKGWLLHLLQIISVSLLPNSAIYPLFNLWRLQGKLLFSGIKSQFTIRKLVVEPALRLFL